MRLMDVYRASIWTRVTIAVQSTLVQETVYVEADSEKNAKLRVQQLFPDCKLANACTIAIHNVIASDPAV